SPVLFPFGDVRKKFPESLTSCDPALLDRSTDACGAFDRTRPAYAIDRPLIRIEPDAAILHPDGVILLLFAHTRKTRLTRHRTRQGTAIRACRNVKSYSLNK